jgi:hypothetical protein
MSDPTNPDKPNEQTPPAPAAAPKPPSLSGARNSLADEWAKKFGGADGTQPTTAGTPPDASPPGTTDPPSTEGEPSDPAEGTPAGDAPVEGDQSEVDPEIEDAERGEMDMSPEDREYLDNLVRQDADRDNFLQEVDLYANEVTPETLAWAEQHRLERLNRLNPQTQTPEGGANRPGAVAPEEVFGGMSAAQRELVPLPKPGHVFPIIRDLTSEYNPQPLNADWLRQFGINPDAMPKAYADAFGKMIDTLNRTQATAVHMRREATNAVQTRDRTKEKLFGTQLEHELKSRGYEIDEGSRALFGEARKIAFNNGQPRSFDVIINDMAKRFPNNFRKASPGPRTAADVLNNPTGTSTEGQPVDTPNTPTPPKPPQGTRAEPARAPAPAPPKPPESLRAARQRFVLDASKRRT